MRFGYYLPLEPKPMLADLLVYLTANDTWYDGESTEQKVQDYMDACDDDDIPKGMPVSHYLIQQHLDAFGSEETVADVTTPLSEERLAYLDDLEAFLVHFGREVCYEAPVYVRIAYYIDAAEYEIMRMIADKDDPQADKEPLSLALYFEFCEETGTEPDPELLENHPYVQAHPEKYQHLSEE